MPASLVTLNVYLFILITIFFFSFNSEIYEKKKKRKKSQNKVLLAHLMAASNIRLTEYQIDNNEKLEDWNDKPKS